MGGILSHGCRSRTILALEEMRSPITGILTKIMRVAANRTELHLWGCRDSERIPRVNIKGYWYINRSYLSAESRGWARGQTELSWYRSAQAQRIGSGRRVEHGTRDLPAPLHVTAVWSQSHEIPQPYSVWISPQSCMLHVISICARSTAALCHWAWNNPAVQLNLAPFLTLMAANEWHDAPERFSVMQWPVQHPELHKSFCNRQVKSQWKNRK